MIAVVYLFGSTTVGWLQDELEEASVCFLLHFFFLLSIYNIFISCCSDLKAKSVHV